MRRHHTLFGPVHHDAAEHQGSDHHGQTHECLEEDHLGVQTLGPGHGSLEKLSVRTACWG